MKRNYLRKMKTVLHTSYIYVNIHIIYIPQNIAFCPIKVEHYIFLLTTCANVTGLLIIVIYVFLVELYKFSYYQRWPECQNIVLPREMLTVIFHIIKHIFSLFFKFYIYKAFCMLYLCKNYNYNYNHLANILLWLL